MKYLVIHADDLGMCHSVNQAIFDCFKDGLITSASIMAPCPWFPEVVEWYSSNNEYDLGAHITLTSEWKHYRWRPLLPKEKVPTLYDEFGYMHRSDKASVGKSWNHLREMKEEMLAQVEHILESGITLSHIDSHMFISSGISEDVKFAEVAAEYDLHYVRSRTLLAPAYVHPNKWFETYDKLLASIPDGGISTLIVHPGYNNAELQGITEGYIAGDTDSRERDRLILYSDHFNKTLKDLNINVVSWKQVAEKSLI